MPETNPIATSRHSTRSRPNNLELVVYNHGLHLNTWSEYYYDGLIAVSVQDDGAIVLALVSREDVGPLYHKAVEKLHQAVFYAWQNGQSKTFGPEQATSIVKVLQKNITDRTGAKARKRK